MRLFSRNHPAKKMKSIRRQHLESVHNVTQADFQRPPVTSSPQETVSATAQVSPVAATRERLQGSPATLKSKSLWDSKSATNARCKSCNARSSRTDHEKTQSRSLSSGIGSGAPAARLHSDRSATPPAASRRQRQTEASANANWCPVANMKPTRAGQTKFAGIPATRMESSGDVRQTLSTILEERHE
jgi:hypothetical protein